MSNIRHLLVSNIWRLLMSNIKHVELRNQSQFSIFFPNSNSLLSHPVLSQKLPYFRRGDRNIDMSYSKMPERVHDSIDDSGRRSDGCGLSDAFCPERMMR